MNKKALEKHIQKLQKDIERLQTIIAKIDKSNKTKVA